MSASVSSRQGSASAGAAPGQTSADDAAHQQAAALFQQMLGQSADPATLAAEQQALAGGASPQDLRGLVAHSDAAKAAINGFYHDVLGVATDPQALANVQAALVAGQSLAQAEAAMRPQFARSATAAASIQALYQGVAGRAAGASELATSEDALAHGQSLDQMRSVLLNSGSASAPAKQVNALYQQVLGRDADLGGLAANEQALAGGATPDQLRSGLAHSDEAGRDLNVFYQEVLGRDADAGGLGVFENALAGGLPLGRVRDALAYSQESTNQVQAVYAKDLGRAASPDELAGYEAAKAMALPPGTTFTVRAPGAAPLASGVDAPTLAANLQSYVAASVNLTPTLATSDGQTVAFKDAKQLAAFAFAQAVASGQDTPATRQAVLGVASWLDQTGQAFAQAAANLRDSAKAATEAGDALQAAVDNAGADLVQQMQATPPAQRHALSERVLLPNQFAADVSVSGDVEGDANGLAGFKATLVDLDPERPGLVQDALAQASAANHDAGNPILAALDQVQERLDLARLRLSPDARHDKMFDVARQFIEHARGAASSGNWNLVQTFETAADVSLQEAAQPAGARQALTERFMHKDVKHDITVDPNSADPFATFKDHSKGKDDVGAIVEAVAGAALNVAAVFYPGLWPAAAALDAAQAGQDFADNNVLGGVFSLASAAGVTLNGLGNGYSVLGLTTENLGLSAGTAKAIGGVTLSAAALAGGTSAVVGAAQKGDGLGIAAGLLQVAAAVADGTIAVQGGGSADLKLGTLGLNVVAGATRLADGAQTGDLATALGDVGALAAALASAVQQVNTDPQLRARLDQLVAEVVASPPAVPVNGGVQGIQFAQNATGTLTDGIIVGDVDAQQLGETREDWEKRLYDKADVLMKNYTSDPAGAKAGLRQINTAISSDPEFQSRYYADVQGMTEQAFYDPTRYGTPVADQSVGSGAYADTTVQDRLRSFVALNDAPTLRMGANGVIYDFSKNFGQVFAPPSALASLYSYNLGITDNLGTQIAERGWKAVPPGLLEMAIIGAVKSPNQLMRVYANSSGTYIDPLTNQPVQTNEVLAADHIVPQSWIKQQPGFSSLSPSDQNALLNEPLNTQGLPQSFNSSKGAKFPGDWQTYKGVSLNTDYIANGVKQAEILKQYFVDKIKILGSK